MRRTGAVFVATFFLAGVAHADEHTTFGGSLLLGADQHVGYDTQTKFAIGFRPEVLFHLDQAAAGVYGEAVHAGDDWLGGGLTAGWFPSPVVALLGSGGIDRRVHADDGGRLTSVFGLFGGIRNIGKSDDGGPYSPPGFASTCAPGGTTSRPPSRSRSSSTSSASSRCW